MPQSLRILSLLLLLAFSAGTFCWHYFWGSGQLGGRQAERRLYPPLRDLLLIDLGKLAVAAIVGSQLAIKAPPQAMRLVWIILALYLVKSCLCSLLPHKVYEHGLIVVSDLGGGAHRFLPWDYLAFAELRGQRCLILIDKQNSRRVRLRFRECDRAYVDSLIQRLQDNEARLQAAAASADE